MKRIPKSVLRAIDAKIAKLKIVNEKCVVKELGAYNIECRMTEWSDNTVNCDVFVIKKSDYSDDPIENVIKSIDGKTMMKNKNEANKFYLKMLKKYSV